MRKSLGSADPQTAAALCRCVTQGLLAVLLKGIWETATSALHRFPSYQGVLYLLLDVGLAPLFPKGYSCKGLPLLLILRSAAQIKLSLCYCHLITILFALFLDHPEILKLTTHTQGRGSHKDMDSRR